ncbi:MAG: hypothetical protein KY456_13060 [Chloroflexi bacterium]|nr:hypothetical protein [Chloroflexota bacterium]
MPRTGVRACAAMCMITHTPDENVTTFAIFATFAKFATFNTFDIFPELCQMPCD